MNRFPLYALAIAFGLGVAFTGCDAATPEAPATPETPAASQRVAAFDGETLLLGIAFGQGPVAALLPEVWGTPGAAEALADVGPKERRAIDYLVRRVREADPDLLARLERDMASGDVRRVLASLDATSAVLNRHLGEASRRGGEVELEVIIDSPVCGMIIALYCVVVMWQDHLDDGGGLTEQTTLAREEIALNLTQRLAAPPVTPPSR